jgi:hypothetical protein
MSITFLPRRGTAIDWATRNPRLREGEMGFEIGTNRYKMGDGVRKWLDLPYFTNEEIIKEYIDAEISDLAGTVSGVTEQEFSDHILEAETPHPNYDDGVTLTLLYENAKV